MIATLKHLENVLSSMQPSTARARFVGLLRGLSAVDEQRGGAAVTCLRFICVSTLHYALSNCFFFLQLIMRVDVPVFRPRGAHARCARWVPWVRDARRSAMPRALQLERQGKQESRNHEQVWQA